MGVIQKGVTQTATSIISDWRIVFPPQLTPSASSGGGAGYSVTWAAYKRKRHISKGSLCALAGSGLIFTTN